MRHGTSSSCLSTAPATAAEGFITITARALSTIPLSLPVGIHEFGHAFGGLADEYYNSQVTYSDFYNLKVEPWEPNITTNIDFPSKWKQWLMQGFQFLHPVMHSMQAKWACSRGAVTFAREYTALSWTAG